MKFCRYWSEKIGAHVPESLARLSENANRENEFLNDLMDSYKKFVILETNEKSVVMDFEMLMDIDPVIRRRMILSSYTDLTGGNIIGNRTSGISFSIMHDLLNLMESDNTTWQMDLGEGIIAQRSYEKMIITSEPVLELNPVKYPVKIPGETDLKEFNGKLVIEITETLPEKTDSPFEAYFDLDKLSLPLEVRNRREGDKISLSGLKGQKKLKDWFIDQKISKHNRSHIPLLCDQDNILWIIGHRRSSHAEVSNETKRIIQITFKSEK